MIGSQHEKSIGIPGSVYVMYGLIISIISIIIYPPFFVDLIENPLRAIFDDNAIILVGALWGIIYMCIGLSTNWRNYNTDRSLKFGAGPAIYIAFFLLIDVCDRCSAFVPNIPYNVSLILVVVSLVLMVGFSIPFLIRGLIQAYGEHKQQRLQNPVPPQKVLRSRTLDLPSP